MIMGSWDMTTYLIKKSEKVSCKRTSSRKPTISIAFMSSSNIDLFFFTFFILAAPSSRYLFHKKQQLKMHNLSMYT